MRSFFADRSGNLAIIFAFSFMALVIAGGAGLDFLRIANNQSDLQFSLDTALLDAATMRNKTDQEVISRAIKVFTSSVRDKDMLRSADLKINKSGITLTGTVTAKTKNIFMGMIGAPETSITVLSSAIGGDSSLELALVLDVTGSMRNEIAGLRSSASKLQQVLFEKALGEVRVAVVPFASAVNPGRTFLKPEHLDNLANSSQHGRNVEGHWVASGQLLASAESQYPGCGTYPPTVLPSTGTSSNTDLGWIEWRNTIFELLSPTSAYAQSVTLNYPTNVPLTGTMSPSGRLYPSGFLFNSYCFNPNWKYEYIANPSKISHFELYKRLPQVTWKGCVEARSEPYDVTDDVPTTKTANTFWWPYFWFDDASQNNWVDDYYNAPFGFLPTGNPKGTVGPTALFKYNSTAKLTIDEVPPITSGPNKGCPDEILPLTADQKTIQAKIDALNYWDAGGTIITEGVVWEWRVLSPTEPFTQGAAYGNKVRKTMVVMSDGINEIASASNTWQSSYTAYGGLRYGRLPAPWTFADSTDYLNKRTLLACENAKAAGIEIYTILFKEVNTTAQTMMKSCATSANHFFRAASTTDLERVFAAIAQEVSKVRLTR